jgi:hypothetical protein
MQSSSFSRHRMRPKRVMSDHKSPSDRSQSSITRHTPRRDEFQGVTDVTRACLYDVAVVDASERGGLCGERLRERRVVSCRT